ncbi:nicotinate-nucleotide diphosphorylase (carboxylating) [bacterium]|nr:MAG: nicotinate-nucleotide diphosphorylase (carboxylating) [bacterium]
MERTDTPAKQQDLNTLTLPEFAELLRQSGYTRRLIELARDEDLGEPAHDWTGELMFASDDQSSVQMRSREPGVVAGLAFLKELVDAFDGMGEILWAAKVNDGDRVEPGTVLAEFSGNARALVALERTMLNLISRLSGIAARTNQFVQLVETTNAKICDTRKTTPGLRAFEKYAVRCGGGTTHRMGLYDAVLIKDNHLAGVSCENLATKIEAVAYKIDNEATKLWFVQVEVDTLDQLKQVLGAKAGVVDIVLLDNMTIEELSQAVAMRDGSESRVLLEASGGVSKATVSAIARTGVDRISVGGLTHQAQSLDIGLDSV